jgi:hypothetical protein
VETSLHHDLKRLYADPTDPRTEVRHGRYRIDAVRGDQLVEIQHGSLAAIRDKARALLAEHRLLVVKPLIAKKFLVNHSAKHGPIVSRRLSPKRAGGLEIFNELVYFTQVFPHPRLTLEVLLVEVEEWRHPGHGRRRRWRKNDFIVADQKLAAVTETLTLRSAADLRTLVERHLSGIRLPRPFDTAQLASALGVARGFAQRIAFCLRETGAVRQVGKQGNALVYQWSRPVARRRAA